MDYINNFTKVAKLSVCILKLLSLGFNLQKFSWRSGANPHSGIVCGGSIASGGGNCLNPAPQTIKLKRLP